MRTCAVDDYCLELVCAAIFINQHTIAQPFSKGRMKIEDLAMTKTFCFHRFFASDCNCWFLCGGTIPDSYNEYFGISPICRRPAFSPIFQDLSLALKCLPCHQTCLNWAIGTAELVVSSLNLGDKFPLVKMIPFGDQVILFKKVKFLGEIFIKLGGE